MEVRRPRVPEHVRAEVADPGAGLETLEEPPYGIATERVCRGGR
jgi:hypothetical protein